MRRPDTIDPLHDRIVSYITQHPGSSGADIEKGVEGQGPRIRMMLKQLVSAGTSHRASSHKRDKAGRTITFEGYYLTEIQASLLVPCTETRQDEQVPLDDASSVPSSLRGDEASRTRHQTDEQTHYTEPPP